MAEESIWAVLKLVPTDTFENPNIGLFPLELSFFFMGFCYFWIQDSYKGTVGKQLVGLEVVNMDGESIGIVDGFLRMIAFVLTAVFNAHDAISHTFVIRKQKS